MYTTSIIWLLMWPATIFVSYLLVKLALKKFDKHLNDE